MKRGGMRARVVMIALLLNAGMALAADWKPERPLEIVAMSGPGGARLEGGRTLFSDREAETALGLAS